jgi:hypothetical protein
MKKLILSLALLAPACGQYPASTIDAPACDVVPLATITGCNSTTSIPLNLLPSTEDLTVYVDGTAQPASAWALTNGGHTLQFVGALCAGGTDAHIVSASVGCVNEHADCNASRGCVP